MYCPKCGQLKTSNASTCECGWDFDSNFVRPPSFASHEPSTDNLASLSQRFFGQILDSLVAIAAILVGAIPAAVSKPIGGITFLCGLGFALFYLLFADGFQGGQSYGKRVMQTAVVDATTGEPCTFGKSFLRNLLLSVLGVIDWVFIFGRMRQRLGDKAANTIVIKTGPRG
jgi:uncharacterized RDD family membrane protein YckC